MFVGAEVQRQSYRHRQGPAEDVSYVNMATRNLESAVPLKFRRAQEAPLQKTTCRSKPRSGLEKIQSVHRQMSQTLLWWPEEKYKVREDCGESDLYLDLRELGCQLQCPLAWLRRVKEL